MAKRKRMAVILSVLFAALMLLSAALPAAHAGGHCAEDHCATCAMIQRLSTLLRCLLGLATLLALLFTVRLFSARFADGALFSQPACTLVSLKVRLNP